MLNTLLWKENSKSQIIGAAIGAFLGLFMLLLSLQIYIDLKQMTNGSITGGKQYVLVNKRVNLFNTLGASSSFTDEEIANLKGQSYIDDLAIFTPNNFRVSASSAILGFYTELFFESVPDNFVDVQSSKWHWSEGDKEIPIILSRDYLALYNFGFAPSQGLPQFTQSTITKVTIDITISGKGLKKVFKGRIIGFSDRINSILVPKRFMDWANQNYGGEDKIGSSRLVLATNDPYSQELKNYLEDNNFEVSSGRLIGGQISGILKKLITVFAIIGTAIVLLAVLIFILNFQLLISRASNNIRLLLQLGYKHTQLSGLLLKHLLKLFALVLLLTFVCLFVTRWIFINWFATQGFHLQFGFHWIVYVAAIAFAFIFVLVNKINIQRNVLSLY